MVLILECFTFTYSVHGKIVVDEMNNNNGLENVYDVIVVGGEPEGVAAAVSAARKGAKTLLVNRHKDLGGLFTYGMLNFLDIPQGEYGRTVSKGIFEEWHKLVGGSSSFDIIKCKIAFLKLVKEEPQITLLTETVVLDSILKDNKVSEIKLRNKKQGIFYVKAKAFIDATQDGDFAAISDVPFYTGAEDIGMKDKSMAVTLMIHLKNVDWKKIKETAKSKKFGEALVRDNVAWGFPKLHYNYIPVEKNTRLRGLNIVKINDEYFINALQIFGVNGLDEGSKKEAIEIGKKETRNVLKFLQKEFPGFEQAQIASFPTELYVRETRHIIAEYQLPMSDIWTNKDHWDSIGIGAYPVDVQTITPYDTGYVLCDPKQYGIPFRSLVPKKVEGLLIVGRSAGYSSLAAGSARIVPTGMVTGEAAGVAAALAIENGVSFHEMSQNAQLIERLRSKLEDQGAFVNHFYTDYPYKDEWYDESIQTLINYGLVVGGYNNNLKVEDVVTIQNFIYLLKGAISRSSPNNHNLKTKLEVILSKFTGNRNETIKLNEATSILSELLIEENTESSDLKLLVDKNIIPDNIAEKISNENHELQRKEVYALLAAVIDFITS